MKKNNVPSIKKTGFSHNTRELRLILLFVVYIILDFLSRLPYLNLFLTFETRITFIWFLILVFLKLPARSSFLFAFLVIILAIISILRGKEGVSEVTGVLVYYLLFIGFVHYLWDYRKKIGAKNEEKA